MFIKYSLPSGENKVITTLKKYQHPKFYPFSSRDVYIFPIYLFFKRVGKAEKKRGRERSVGCHSHVPQPGDKCTTQTCALTGNRTSDLSIFGTIPKRQSYTRQGNIFPNSYNTSLFNYILIIKNGNYGMYRLFKF